MGLLIFRFSGLEKIVLFLFTCNVISSQSKLNQAVGSILLFQTTWICVEILFLGCFLRENKLNSKFQSKWQQQFQLPERMCIVANQHNVNGGGRRFGWMLCCDLPPQAHHRSLSLLNIVISETTRFWRTKRTNNQFAQWWWHTAYHTHSCFTTGTQCSSSENQSAAAAGCRMVRCVMRDIYCICFCLMCNVWVVVSTIFSHITVL